MSSPKFISNEDLQRLYTRRADSFAKLGMLIKSTLKFGLSPNGYEYADWENTDTDKPIEWKEWREGEGVPLFSARWNWQIGRPKGLVRATVIRIECVEKNGNVLVAAVQLRLPPGTELKSGMILKEVN